MSAVISKNAFEIRSDLIHTASRTLEQQHQAEMEQWRFITSAIVGNLGVQFTDVESAVKFHQDLQAKLPAVPAAPSASSITAAAETLYAFVTKK